MSGRIRTIKPELLDDAKTAGLPDREWRLFISLILLADDHGNTHGDVRRIEGAAFWAAGAPNQGIEEALETLARVSLITRYTVRGQTYIAVNGWAKHQRVDKPSKPRVPGPSEADAPFIREGLAKPSGDSREGLATDLRPPTSDQGSPTPTVAGRVVLTNPAAEPPAPKRFEPTREMVRRLLRREYVSRTGNPPADGKPMAEASAALSEWLDACDDDAEKLFEQCLHDFFEDRWVIDNGYPLAALVKNPGKYLAPTRGGGPGGSGGPGPASTGTYSKAYDPTMARPAPELPSAEERSKLLPRPGARS